MGISLKHLNEKVRVIRRAKTLDGEGGADYNDEVIIIKFPILIFVHRPGSLRVYLGEWAPSAFAEHGLDNPRAICRIDSRVQEGYIIEKEDGTRFRISRVLTVKHRKKNHHMELLLNEERI